MFPNEQFIRQSLGLHLFFARIMKEHSLFLEMGFTGRDVKWAQRADELRREFDLILGEAIDLANGFINPRILRSGELVTPFTLEAERQTTFYTGIKIPVQLTEKTIQLVRGSGGGANTELRRRVQELNSRAIRAIMMVARFKRDVLSNVLACKMFTMNYPLLIEHVLREAELYLAQVSNLQEGKPEEGGLRLEVFWGRQMMEHIEFIRGLLDPTERALISQANDIIDDFLRMEFNQVLVAENLPLDIVNAPGDIHSQKLRVATNIRNYKAQGTEGILGCKVKSIIIPLLGDHVLREANHYLRIVENF